LDRKFGLFAAKAKLILEPLDLGLVDFVLCSSCRCRGGRRGRGSVGRIRRSNRLCRSNPINRRRRSSSGAGHATGYAAEQRADSALNCSLARDTFKRRRNIALPLQSHVGGDLLLPTLQGFGPAFSEAFLYYSTCNAARGGPLCYFSSQPGSYLGGQTRNRGTLDTRRVSQGPDEGADSDLVSVFTDVLLCSVSRELGVRFGSAVFHKRVFDA
jgi:hypothetical protein